MAHLVLVVENGTQVVGANSFVSVVDFREYAENRGVILPVTDSLVIPFLVKALDYIESKACEFQGTLVLETQALSWPRSGAIVNGRNIAQTSIPKQLIDAQCQAAIAVNAGLELLPNSTVSDYVIEETVGPITTKYADPSKVRLGNLAPTLGAVDTLLAPLFKTCEASTFSLMTVRV